MAFSIEITRDLAGGTTLEQLVAQIISTNPAASAAAAKKAKNQLDQIKKAALRITSARLRKYIIEAYANNTLDWPEHRTYSNWLGKFGPVVFGHLTRMNRPKKAVTKKGTARKAGYSQSYAINPPQPYQIGGRLAKATRYKISNDTTTVGIMETAIKNAAKMRSFQDGKTTPAKGDPESARRWLATMGIYIRRGTVFSSPRRPLYEQIQEKYPPVKIFEQAFVDGVTDKIRIGT